MTAPAPAPPRALVRPRRAADLPVLVDALAEQQPRTGYPLRWPLPFPVEDFLVRPGEERAWVAEVGGAAVGHVVVGSADPALAASFAEVTGEAPLAAVSALFVGTASRGTGLGGRLLDTAVGWARAQGRVPVLDVLPTNAAAYGLYRRRGWRVVGGARPGWLPAGAPDVVLMTLPG